MDLFSSVVVTRRIRYYMLTFYLQTTLTYDCVCANGQSPNVTEYSQTLPFYICQEWGTQCVANCGQDNTCSNDCRYVDSRPFPHPAQLELILSCRANHPCGAQDPTRVNTTSSSTMAATATGGKGSTQTATSIITGFGGAAATTTGGANSGHSAASAMVNIGQSYGLAIVFASVFAGFAILL